MVWFAIVPQLLFTGFDYTLTRHYADWYQITLLKSLQLSCSGTQRVFNENTTVTLQHVQRSL
jgi:hypothetical protein